MSSLTVEMSMRIWYNMILSACAKNSGTRQDIQRITWHKARHILESNDVTEQQEKEDNILTGGNYTLYILICPAGYNRICEREQVGRCISWYTQWLERNILDLRWQTAQIWLANCLCAPNVASPWVSSLPSYTWSHYSWSWIFPVPWIQSWTNNHYRPSWKHWQ